MRRVWLTALSTGAAAASLFFASSAKAEDCPSDAIFIHGSSASQKIVEAIAKVAATNNIKIVYSSSGSSCGGGVYDAVTPTGGTYVATALTSYDPAAQGATCTMNPARAADIGVSDVYPSSCAGIGGLPSPLTLGADVADILGPVQAFTIAVHDDPSYPVAISAEAAFNTFGIIGRGGATTFGVTPWTVEADVFGRAEDSGTWQTWARNLGLITTKPVFKAEQGGGQQTGAGAMLSILNSSARSSAIGIIALNDIVTPTGGSAPQVRPLAFKARGQDFAYYPSTTSTSSDLMNVRDGHYQTWANLHFLPRKSGGAYSAGVQAVLTQLEGEAVTAAIAKIRAVPKCAMQVSRSADGGDFSVYTPEKSCGCYFEAQASGTAPASCKTCTADPDCGSASSQCVFGYCEAK